MTAVDALRPSDGDQYQLTPRLGDGAAELEVERELVEHLLGMCVGTK